jgi:hypothetical protein
MSSLQVGEKRSEALLSVVTVGVLATPAVAESDG